MKTLQKRQKEEQLVIPLSIPRHSLLCEHGPYVKLLQPAILHLKINDVPS